MFDTEKGRGGFWERLVGGSVSGRGLSASIASARTLPETLTGQSAQPLTPAEGECGSSNGQGARAKVSSWSFITKVSAGRVWHRSARGCYPSSPKMEASGFMTGTSRW